MYPPCPGADNALWEGRTHTCDHLIHPTPCTHAHTLATQAPGATTRTGTRWGRSSPPAATARAAWLAGRAAAPHSRRSGWGRLRRSCRARRWWVQRVGGRPGSRAGAAGAQGRGRGSCDVPLRVPWMGYSRWLGLRVRAARLRIRFDRADCAVVCTCVCRPEPGVLPPYSAARAAGARGHGASGGGGGGAAGEGR